jgi:GMP synthase (glutamine-hydrolysing)
VRAYSVVHERDAGAGVFGRFPIWIPGEQPTPSLEDVDALLIFGGSMHVDQNDGHGWMAPEKVLIREALEHGTPMLGVCLGSQLLAEAAGARPRRMEEPEIGWYEIEITDAGASDPVVGPLAPSAELFEWHHYAAPLPPGGVELARTPACVQAFRIEGKPAWGLQFHAEVTREDLFSWLDGWEEAEAAQTDFDPDAIRAASERRIEEQNELGRGIAERFLAEAARARAG